jgi:hypothetical protein
MPARLRKKKAFALQLMEYLENYTTGNLIIGGGFNWVGDEIDRDGPLTCNDKGTKATMEKIMTSLDLNHIYRVLNLPRVGYTYTYGNGRASRIDKFWGTNFGTINYNKSGILEYKISDHKLIFLEIGIKDKRVK